MTITDEMLYESAPKAAELFLNTLPGREDCAHAFSQGFERKMRSLLTGVKAPAWRWKRTLLIAALVAALLAAGAAALRGSVFRIFRAETAEGTRYAYRAGEKPEGFQPAVLGYVPKGYAETDTYRKESETWTRYVWTYQDGEGGSFRVVQHMTDTLTIDLGPEYTLEGHPVINGTEAELYVRETGEETLLLWTDGPYVLEVAGTPEKEEIIKIAEQIDCGK
ncbi:DUF4367 domain-containing protein [Dysosmobacter sp.]|uniref:DUF4367 domain-containing protein n=1 Tax=Dysosmobacter sp. TaxID=2591382 RepID=UPI002A854F5A|nr:DUF4367 domain-containing protein [Dysosmobacter sp.]MDY3984871.1 DUF4367 domain-containing protein [Dysosmobacter sp.]